MRTEIIYEDNDLLVVYKPAGLATQTAKLGQADVVSELKCYLAKPGIKNVYLGIIHRLDQPVEGLLVFAKNQKAAAQLTAQLQKQGQGGNLNKQYYAVVCGKTTQDQGRLVDYMYKNRENMAVIVNKPEGEAKQAILEYRMVSQMQPDEAQGRTLHLADIHILTGRFHQIRAQMAHAGMPLLGDAKYAPGDVAELAKSLGVQTVALCAYRLDLVHPVTKKEMHFEVKPRGKSFAYFSQSFS